MSRLLFDHPGSNGRRPRRSTPSLESLEDRTMLATFSPLASAADGSGHSLRAAIIQADSNGQDNTINLQSGFYHLSIPNPVGQNLGASAGDLDLAGAGHTITIQGAGLTSTIIDGAKINRIFEILPGVNVIIRDLTIRDGIALDLGSSGAAPGGGVAAGGGLINGGTTELDRVDIDGCAASAGNGNDGSAGSPQGTSGYAAMGGAIYNTGTLTLNQCLIRFNFVNGGNGGAGAGSSDSSGAGGAGGPGYGGGIYNAGSLAVFQSTIADNQSAGGDGGKGGASSGHIGPFGGQAGNGYGGGLYQGMNASKTTIVDSTIAENTAQGAVGGNGGQGGNEGDPLTTPGDYGGTGGSGGTGEGGAIFAVTPLSLYNDTIATNHAYGGFAGLGGAGGTGVTSGSQGQTGDMGPGFAGGIFAPSNPGDPGPLASVSTIIALNTSAMPNVPDAEDDNVATFASAANTLLGSGNGSSGITNGTGGNLVGLDPMLGPLQNNGGPTLTMALLAGSPAIGAGSNPMNLTADQRGYTPRVAGAAADIGAFEVAAGAGPITVNVKKVKGRREILVYDARTKVLKFAMYPFGNSYRGNFQVTERDVNGDGVSDVIVKRSRSHHKFILVVYSGVDGSPLPANLV